MSETVTISTISCFLTLTPIKRVMSALHRRGRDSATIIRLAKGRSRAIRVLKCRHRQHCAFATSSVGVAHHLHSICCGFHSCSPVAHALKLAPFLGAQSSLLSMFLLVLSLQYLAASLDPFVQAC